MTTSNVSRLDQAGLCMQRYAWQYESLPADYGFPALRGIVPRREMTPELDLGVAVHAGLAMWYDCAGFDKMPDSRRLSNAILAYQESIQEQVGTEEHPQRGLGERMLRAYFEWYRDADREWEVVGAERAFASHLGDQDVLLGRWDLLVRHHGLGGTLWHVQHKTVGKTVGLGSYVRRYDLAWHERLYVPAAAEAFPGERIGGTILNLLRKSDRIRPEQDFLRYYVPTADPERFQRDARARLRRIDEARRSGLWEQQPGACLQYGRLCPYHGLCLGVPVDLESEFSAREADYVDEAAEKALGAMKGEAR